MESIHDGTFPPTIVVLAKGSLALLSFCHSTPFRLHIMCIVKHIINRHQTFEKFAPPLKPNNSAILTAAVYFL
jgi:hypothetical protein